MFLSQSPYKKIFKICFTALCLSYTTLAYSLVPRDIQLRIFVPTRQNIIRKVGLLYNSVIDRVSMDGPDNRVDISA